MTDLRSDSKLPESSEPTNRFKSTDYPASESTGWSLLYGIALATAFYLVVTFAPLRGELVERYFCSHPLEYATTGLFFIGIAILIRKAIRLRRERTVAELNWTGLSHAASNPSDASLFADHIDSRIESISASLHGTHLARRIASVGRYIRGRRSVEGLEDHLKYLAEMAAERSHESYALVRTVTWAVPILGFLGTVIGITIAIANVTPEQLDTSLGEVTSGLAVAFDTTALALALSIVLVFTSFLVERAEQQVLTSVEDFGIDRIVAALPASQTYSGVGSALIQAEEQAVKNLLEGTENVIHRQTQLWQDGLQSVRESWLNTLSSRTDEFQAALRDGMSQTLTNHSEQLQQTRTEMMDVFRQAIIEHAESMSRLSEETSGRVERWHDALRESSRNAADQTELLRQHGELLQSLLEQEGQLATIQSRLTENLEAVRAAETFDETLHNLTAAVHLLTARSRPKAA